MPPIQVLATEIVASLEPHEIVLRLVERALDIVPADRCTLTSVDQRVLRVEASYDVAGGRPAWIGKEYPAEMARSQGTLREALETGRIAIGDGFTLDSADPALVPDLEAIRHTAVVPLSLGDEVGAVLILSRRDDVEFLPEELTSLQEIGVLAVMALRNARLFQAVHAAQERGLQALTLISQNLASSDELPTFFGKMSASVAGLVSAERAAFWMIEGTQLVAQAEAFGFDLDTLRGLRIPLPTETTAPLARVLYSGQALRAQAGAATPAGSDDGLLQLLGVRDFVAVPWRTADRPLGLLMACDSLEGFGDQEEWVMRVNARSSAVVWQGYEAERRVIAMQERERRRLEDHARRMADLEQQKSQFLRLASHELRTPLTIVRGYLSMFEEEVFGPMPPQVTEVLPTITARVAQMNLMIDQMLNAARLEDNRLVVSTQRFSVTETAAKVLRSFEGLGTDAHRLLLDSPQGQAVIEADPEKVETIIANLVSNAIKYSPGGGETRCAVKVHPGGVTVAVSDQGVGIAPEDLPRLFQRFGRLERPETANIEGTGLGLFLSRELAQALGGDVAVSSVPGEGSTFTLTLPSPTAPGA